MHAPRVKNKWFVYKAYTSERNSTNVAGQTPLVQLRHAEFCFSFSAAKTSHQTQGQTDIRNWSGLGRATTINIVMKDQVADHNIAHMHILSNGYSVMDTAKRVDMFGACQSVSHTTREAVTDITK